MAGVKRVSLTMQQRLDVLKDLETSSIATVAAKYNVHYTTVRRIKQKAAVIGEFEDQDSKAKRRQRVRKPKFEELEERLLKLFIERRTVGDYISDALLIEKATELKEEFGAPSQFKVSKGWLAKFKRRNNIRLVRVYGEKASADEDGARKFVADFQTFMEDEEINPENVYNMDESALLWKALPVKTLPRALKHFMNRLPVVFRAQANAWMSQTLFLDWVDNCFKKSVRQYQLENGLCGKVVLIIDNCASHKLPINYVQDDHFIIKYLAPNTTSLIQPMDQGIIAKFKRSFRHKLTQRLVSYGSGAEQFFKTYDESKFTVNETNGRILVNMDKWQYLQILKQNLKQSAEKLGILNTFHMYQDNDPKHKAAIIREWLLYNCPKVLEPPPQSPDLNIIENVWHELEVRIRQHHIKNEEEEQQEEEENLVPEMQQLLTSISEHNVTSEEVEEYLNECSEEEETYSRKIDDTDESRDKDKDEERVEDKDEEREEPWEEEQEEESNESDRTQERGIPVNREERQELKDIFRRLERYKNRIPRSSELLLEAMKLLFLGETTSNT
ncbi:jerky protein homolog-like [Osmia bicornis bicornis]|uniref:jerky protein homolog-like n=1 Tax=Osmia bicornis bicornis TaxID=1437191 RepID=UPI001EAEBA40|nr:jerky protein homolog-like [Osmia bicornis bicornis]